MFGVQKYNKINYFKNSDRFHEGFQDEGGDSGHDAEEYISAAQNDESIAGDAEQERGRVHHWGGSPAEKSG